ncbi:PglD-related sugar-binding protein [Ferruginibacter sp.]
MLFIGAGGLAAQLFEDLLKMKIEDAVFWSETETENIFIKEKFKIISTDEEVVDYFTNTSKDFVICLGDVKQRKKMAERFTALGGNLASFISPFGNFSPYVKSIGAGTIILRDVDVEPSVTIGELCLLNKQTNFGHGCKVGAFCDIGPMVTVSADAEVGDNCIVGMGTIIIPRIKVGSNVVISAGSVVTKNIPDYAVVEGVPAAIRFYRKK